MGQWEGRMTCTTRNTLTRAIPLSLQLRQFDLVLGATRQPSRQRRTSRSRNRRPIPELPGKHVPNGGFRVLAATEIVTQRYHT